MRQYLSLHRLYDILHDLNKLVIETLSMDQMLPVVMVLEEENAKEYSFKKIKFRDDSNIMTSTLF